MKTICVSVSNDLYNDNRVLRTCSSLSSLGLNVKVICKDTTKNRKKQYAPLEKKYSFLRIHRLGFIFRKNFLYYAELNIRIFCTLLFQKVDILWANDLDTLPANYIISKLKHIPLIFDSHEMFCYVAELRPNSFQQKCWLKIEKSIVPKLKYIVTVCNPIKEYFKKQYNVDATVIRNIPPYIENNNPKKVFPLTEKYIIWQGATNIDRGLEELITAMQYIDCKLIICGNGDIFPLLQKLVNTYHLHTKVLLKGKIDFEKMMLLTRNASLGISIDKPTNQNYAISLPNKIFEYINSATPVLYSPLTEIKAIEEEFITGIALQGYETSTLASQINEILSNNSLLQQLSDNCLIAQKYLNWQNEQQILHNLLETILQQRL